jgi:hypothetical protein
MEIGLLLHSRDNSVGMKFFKFLIFPLSGHNSIKLFSLSSSIFSNLIVFDQVPNRNYCVTENIKNVSEETVNQSSLPEKERTHSNDFEISHDGKLNLHNGISRIVKRIDLKFLTSGFNGLIANIHPKEKQDVFHRLNLFFILIILPKKLYLPNVSLQLFNIYVRNYYIRRLNGQYIKYTETYY